MEKEPIIIEAKLSKITRDKKQTRVSIPSDIVLEFLINPKKDAFLWIIEEMDEGISLKGNLIKNINLKNEKKT